MWINWIYRCDNIGILFISGKAVRRNIFCWAFSNLFRDNISILFLPVSQENMSSGKSFVEFSKELFLFYNQPFMHMDIVEKDLFRIPWDYFNYEWNVNAFKTIYTAEFEVPTKNVGAKASTKNFKKLKFYSSALG